MPSHGLFPSLHSRPRASSLPAQTRNIAIICRSKLALEADRGEHRLSRLVGHANLLDNLVIKLGEEKREQNQRVRADSPWPQIVHRSPKFEWIDDIADELDEEESDDDSPLDNADHGVESSDYFGSTTLPSPSPGRRSTFSGRSSRPPSLSKQLTDYFSLDDGEDDSSDDEAEEEDSDIEMVDEAMEGHEVEVPENLILTRCPSHGKPGYTPAADVVQAALSNLQMLDLNRSKRTASIDSSSTAATTVPALGAA